MFLRLYYFLINIVLIECMQPMNTKYFVFSANVPFHYCHVIFYCLQFKSLFAFMVFTLQNHFTVQQVSVVNSSNTNYVNFVVMVQNVNLVISAIKSCNHGLLGMFACIVRNLLQYDSHCQLHSPQSIV